MATIESPRPGTVQGEVRMLIDGELVEAASGKRFENINAEASAPSWWTQAAGNSKRQGVRSSSFSDTRTTTRDSGLRLPEREASRANGTCLTTCSYC